MSRTNKYHVKDRVIYIGDKTDLIYYPPKNTEGTVVAVFDKEEQCDIVWDNNVEEGKHRYKYSEIKKSYGCIYCQDASALYIDKKDLKLRINKSRLSIKKDDTVYSTIINYCLYCGRKLR